MPRIVIDPDRCSVAGECVYNHPTYFAWPDDGDDGADDDATVVIRPEITNDEDRRHADQAIAGCPEGAISLQ